MLAIGEREAPAGWPCQAKRRGDFLRHDRDRLLVALVVRIDTLSTLWAEEVIRHRQARLQDVAASRWPEARGQPLGVRVVRTGRPARTGNRPVGEGFDSGWWLTTCSWHAPPDHRRSGDGRSLAYGIERQNSLDPSGPPRSGIRAHCRALRSSSNRRNQPNRDHCWLLCHFAVSGDDVDLAALLVLPS
jgi:hypothetical protein